MADHLKRFTIEDILKLDEGKLSVAANHELQRVLENINDSPCNVVGKSKKRKLIIELEFEPHVKEDKSGMRRWVTESISVVPSISAKLPKIVGGINQVKLIVNRSGVEGRWNPEIPDDLDQPSLFEEDPLDASK